MSQPGSGFSGNVDGVHEVGSRRRKIAGYLKAANDLRQSYQSSASQQWATRNAEHREDVHDIPGAFPDVTITRNGHEELILFPSYCKRHLHAKHHTSTSGTRTLDVRTEGTGDAEWWRQQWDSWEDEKAILDVDVRGWVYSPHQGPMSRKNRVLVGLARQLSGISAPKDEAGSRDTSPAPHSLLARHEAHEAQRDQEKIALEAAEILRKGEKEEHIASYGGYSEVAKDDSDSAHGSGNNTPFHEDPPGPGHLNKRSSWNHPSNMSSEELAKANRNLMARLMPFLTNPLTAVPVTVFFYDEKKTQSKTVQTDEAGHFNLRAPLDFVPTHVRVLASENLSATEEVKITEPKGISLISDVDDTVKHSSIGSGAREIFRNAFIRDLADLTIDGVKEWYNTMYDMGVGFHYVSNSPWQLFPVLATFFRCAGLPPGSYHLKQYSGMLQGIFEPVAERKKGTLERILRDFPERLFLLVGDSGEADLELYVDVVLANPGRVIGVFIRDVTTPITKGFFDTSLGPLNADRGKIRKRISRGWSRDSSQSRQSTHAAEQRPALPARIVSEAAPRSSDGPIMGNLIDFEDEPEEMNVHESHSRVIPRSNSDLAELISPRRLSAPENNSKIPPMRPAKPLNLRSMPADARSSNTASPPKLPPPKSNSVGTTHEASPLSQTQNTSDGFSPAVHDQGLISAARQKVSSAYNAITPASSYLPTTLSSSHKPISAPSSPPLLPSRGVTVAAASYASHRLSWGTKSVENSDDDSAEPVNKKLDLWRRRWKRARAILDAHGVELRSWREGQDVAHLAVRLVEKRMQELGVEGYGGVRGKGKTGEGGGEVKVVDLKREKR